MRPILLMLAANVSMSVGRADEIPVFFSDRVGFAAETVALTTEGLDDTTTTEV